MTTLKDQITVNHRWIARVGVAKSPNVGLNSGGVWPGEDGYMVGLKSQVGELQIFFQIFCSH